MRKEEGGTSHSTKSPLCDVTLVPVPPRLCVDGGARLLHFTVLGPLLNLMAHGLDAQMVHCNLRCTFHATLPSRASWGHRFQLRPPPPMPPSLPAPDN